MVAVTSAFTGTGNGSVFAPKASEVAHPRGFNIAASGTFVGTVVLEKSFDLGTTWIAVLRPGTSTAISYTTPGAEVLAEPEVGVQYRWRCSAFTSGTINTRLSN